MSFLCLIITFSTFPKKKKKTKNNKQQTSQEPHMNFHLPLRRKKKQETLIEDNFAFCHMVIMIDINSTNDPHDQQAALPRHPLILSFPRPPPADGRAAIVPKVSVVEDQRQVVCVVAVVYGGYADARAPLQGRKESGRDAVEEPHPHPVELSAPRSRRAMARGGPDFGLDRTRS